MKRTAMSNEERRRLQYDIFFRCKAARIEFSDKDGNKIPINVLTDQQLLCLSNKVK